MTRDLNPFESAVRSNAESTRRLPSRSSTSLFAATSNHDLFIQILQSLRPKSRRTRGSLAHRHDGGLEHDDGQPGTATSARARERFPIS